jgi:putative hydrolase of the HAD superfamily
MIKAIIFDLDNTLIDFIKMKRISCEAAITAMIDAGLSLEKENALSILFNLYDKYGMEDPRIFQKFLDSAVGNIDYKILASGIVAYRKVRSGFLEPYPHVIYTLIKLRERGKKLAIVTDAPRIKAWIRLASMRLIDFFDAVVTFEDTLHNKPSSLPFIATLKKLALKPSECLMVGDWPERDIEGAKKLGLKTCFASYGNPKIKNVDADYRINDIMEILDIV